MKDTVDIRYFIGANCDTIHSFVAVKL